MSAVGRICKVCGDVNCAAHRRVSPSYVQTQRRKAAVQDHIQAYGMYCPGWLNRPGHLVTPPNDLTADHIIPVARGGSEDGPLRVLCRSCNSAKADNVPPNFIR